MEFMDIKTPGTRTDTCPRNDQSIFKIWISVPILKEVSWHRLTAKRSYLQHQQGVSARKELLLQPEPAWFEKQPELIPHQRHSATEDPLFLWFPEEGPRAHPIRMEGLNDGRYIAPPRMEGRGLEAEAGTPTTGLAAERT